MSMPGQRQPRVPTLPQGVEIASFPTYLEAQHAVDTLADGAFAVQAVTIVGSDLRMVERVTGRLNYPRVAAAGALSGVWFGLFVGLIFSMFSEGAFLVTIVTCAAIGAAFGMLFGVISYAFTGGRRDFTSASQVVASRYDLLCLPELADEARRRLREAGVAIHTSAQHPVGPGLHAPGGGFGRPAEAPRTVVARPAGPPRYGHRIDSQHAPSPSPSRTERPDPASQPPRYGQRIDQPPTTPGGARPVGASAAGAAGAGSVADRPESTRAPRMTGTPLPPVPGTPQAKAPEPTTAPAQSADAEVAEAQEAPEVAGPTAPEVAEAQEVAAPEASEREHTD